MDAGSDFTRTIKVILLVLCETEVLLQYRNPRIRLLLVAWEVGATLARSLPLLRRGTEAFVAEWFWHRISPRVQNSNDCVALYGRSSICSLGHSNEVPWSRCLELKCLARKHRQYLLLTCNPLHKEIFRHWETDSIIFMYRVLAWIACNDIAYH